MGTHSTPILFLGKIFENESEAIDFLVEKKSLTKEKAKEIKEASRQGRYFLDEYIWSNQKKLNPSFPSAQRLDLVTGEGYFLGYELYPLKMEKELEEFLDSFNLAKVNWLHHFNEVGKIHHMIETT